MKKLLLALILIPTIAYAGISTVPWFRNSAGPYVYPPIGDLIGFGTTTPLASVDIFGKAGFMPFRVSSSTGASYFEVEQNGNIGVGTATPVSLLSVIGSSGLNSSSVFSVGTTSNLFDIRGDGSFTINGTTTGSALTINATQTAGTAIGLNLNSISGNGVGISMTGLTSNGVVGIDTSLGGTNAVAIRVNTTGAGNSTAKAIYVTGNANLTSDYTSAYISLDSTRNVSANATRTFSGNAMSINPSFTLSGGNANSTLQVTGTTTQFGRTLSNASTGANANIAVTSPVFSIFNVKGAGNGTTTDSGSVLEVLQGFASSTGTVLRLTNNGTGNLAAFTGTGNFGIGTSTPQALLSVANASATTTVYIGAAGFPGRIIMRDTPSGGACTQITTAGGVITGAAVTCP